MPVGADWLRETPMDHWPKTAKREFTRGLTEILEAKVKRLDLFKPWSTLDQLTDQLAEELAQWTP